MKPSTSHTSAAIVRVAALILLLSVLLVVDGCSRMNLVIGTPSGSWGGSHSMYPPAVQLAASVGLAFYGILGLANSFYVLVLGNGSSVVTFTILAIEFPLGWFFFSVWVLSAYPFMVARAAGPIPGLTGVESNAIIMMGFLGAFGLGVPLLAGHFYFTLQLAQFQRGMAHIYTPAYSNARVYFYASLNLVRAVAEITVGGIIKNHIGSGRLAASELDIPFIVTFPAINIADGALVLFVALLALAIAAARLSALRIPFAALSLFCWVAQLALIITTQIGINPTNPIIVGSILVGDSFVAMLMPAYLLLEAGREGMLEEMDDMDEKKAVANGEAEAAVV